YVKNMQEMLDFGLILSIIHRFVLLRIMRDANPFSRLEKCMPFPQYRWKRMRAVTLIEDRGQICAFGLIVEPHCHQRHGLGNAQAVGQTPAKKRTVARWHQDSGARKGIGGGDEGLQVDIRFSGGVAKGAKQRRVSRDPAAPLHEHSSALLNAFSQLLTAI